jgi:VIT1/CCC1 family predicted Fe2+/Mn2+ transporter
LKQRDANMSHLTRFSFGATSAIITCLAFIIGLSKITNSKLNIIGSLLVIAIADNISDTLGIHIFQESDLKKSEVVRVSTFLNFITRFFVILIFILLVLFLPTGYAIIFSIVWGLSLLTVLSYLIAKEQKINPFKAVFWHIALAVLVIIVSNFLTEWIMNIFSKL